MRTAAYQNVSSCTRGARVVPARGALCQMPASLRICGRRLLRMSVSAQVRAKTNEASWTGATHLRMAATTSCASASLHIAVHGTSVSSL